jgi:hypothetical protein
MNISHVKDKDRPVRLKFPSPDYTIQRFSLTFLSYRFPSLPALLDSRMSVSLSIYSRVHVMAALPISYALFKCAGPCVECFSRN